MNNKLTPQEQEKLEEICLQSFEFARQNDVDSLKILLQYGLNVNLSNHKGDTLLMLAAYNGNYEATKLLLESGAIVDKMNDKGHTPLAGVCFKGYVDIAKLLLEYGASVDIQGALSPLNCAIMFKRSEIIPLLLKYRNKKLNIVQKLAIWLYSRFSK